MHASKSTDSQSCSCMKHPSLNEIHGSIDFPSPRAVSQTGRSVFGSPWGLRFGHLRIRTDWIFPIMAAMVFTLATACTETLKEISSVDLYSIYEQGKATSQGLSEGQTIVVSGTIRSFQTDEFLDLSLVLRGDDAGDVICNLSQEQPNLENISQELNDLFLNRYDYILTPSFGTSGKNDWSQTLVAFFSEPDHRLLKVKGKLSGSESQVILDECTMEGLGEISAVRDRPGRTVSETLMDFDKATQKVVRPSTGIINTRVQSSGMGELLIRNGSNRDGAIILATPQGNSVKAAFIRMDDSFTLVGIPDGHYVVYFTTGEAWSSDQRRFTQDFTYQRFDEELYFETTSQRYSVWNVTLHPVVGGNAVTRAVSQDSFPQLN